MRNRSIGIILWGLDRFQRIEIKALIKFCENANR